MELIYIHFEIYLEINFECERGLTAVCAYIDQFADKTTVLHHQLPVNTKLQIHKWIVLTQFNFYRHTSTCNKLITQWHTVKNYLDRSCGVTSGTFSRGREPTPGIWWVSDQYIQEFTRINCVQQASVSTWVSLSTFTRWQQFVSLLPAIGGHTVAPSGLTLDFATHF